MPVTGKCGFRVKIVTTGQVFALLVFVLAAGSAAAQIRVVRSVDYDFIVDPRVVSLARVEELRPVGAVVDAWMTVIPDKVIPTTSEGENVVFVLKTFASRMSGTFKSRAELDRAAGGSSEAVSQLVQFSGASLRLVTKFENNPDLARKLRQDNFTRLDSKSFKLGGKTYTLTRWLKRKGDLRELLGTASAVLNLKANPTIGRVTSVFEGNFQKTESSKISADGLPKAGPARDLARARYEVFRRKANENFNRVLKALNTPQPMLSEQERMSLAEQPAGKRMEFIRTIPYTWYGDRKTVKIIVKATLGPRRIQFLDQDAAIKPYRDD